LPRNVVDGIRVNAALAYISPNRNRANLTIESSISARRVVMSGRRAVGVEVERSGRIETVTGDEIVLCAGAVMSPHLLLLSGVGPALQLRQHGIDIVADLPGVGSRCCDHPQVFLGFESSDVPARQAKAAIVEVGLDADIDHVPVAVMPYLADGRTGPRLRSVGDRVGPGCVAAPSRQHGEACRWHLPTLLRSRRSTTTGSNRPSTATISSVRPRSAWPSSNPRPCAHWGGKHTSPAAGRSRRVDRRQHHHRCTSVLERPMGPDSDPTAVVDQYCRVRGWRVCGSSTRRSCPRPVARSGCNAVLIGERASAFFDDARIVSALTLTDHLIAASPPRAGAVNALPAAER
jgi:choline dehydrogenase-like flavoprotein